MCKKHFFEHDGIQDIINLVLHGKYQTQSDQGEIMVEMENLYSVQI